ncbi:hypothetical protein F2Q69_00062132 [Brassica cretica]|uniref:Pentacotripeptide-repeat region of PRORP domain-containing protein n=1 Tax=Brassica cretica TaxID=69181 RepID=A0A8S9RBT3_BRACR|nr:hypothetical protein F2Q69_00062132 [Brassica cretica]
MLSAYVNASDMEGAEKFFKRIKVDGFEPNIVTYGTMIKGYAKANDLDKAMEVYEKMRLSGIKANQTILTTIMDASGRCKDFGSALSWYKEMESCGIPADQKAKNVLLSLASSQDELEEAKEVTGLIDEKTTSLAGVDGTDDDDDEDNYITIYEMKLLLNPKKRKVILYSFGSYHSHLHKFLTNELHCPPATYIHSTGKNFGL